MKKFILLFVLTFTMAAANMLSAQKNEAKISIVKSDRYSLDPNAKVSILEGNVAITFGKLDIFKADKVTIDKEANKIIVLGYKEFSFKGKLVVVPAFDRKYTTLEYTIGEDVAYIK